MFAAVRVRGQPDTRKAARETLDNLGLRQKNHCLLLPETDANEGMLQQAKDVITYGRIDEDLAAELLEARGRTDHGPLADAVEEVGYDSIEDLVEDLEDGDVTIGDLKADGFRNVVPLTPPSKGYKDTRRGFNQGGSLGDREDAMEQLLRRMF